tara:strand:+ start:8237 stop:9643 length:1407 start_codon:yes stop_codon:yes gene_type:complete
MAKEVLEMEIKSNTGDVTKDVEKLDKATDKASGGFKGMGTAIKGMGTALKAAGIGLVVALFAKLMEVFSKNQKVLDFFNTGMEALSIAFNDLFKFLDANIGTVVNYFKSIFEDPKQSLIDFGTAIKDNLIERFNSVLDTLGHLAKAIGHLFKGEFAEAKDEAINAGKEMVDVWTGVDNSVDKITTTVTKAAGAIKDYTTETLKGAKAIVELRNQSELAAVQVQGLIEDYDRQAEKLRQVRDDESKTFEERIAANNKLGEVLKEQEKEMLKLVDIQIASAQADVNKNNNLENQIKLQEALNEKKGVLAQITGFESEQLTNNIALQKEQQAVAQENADAQLEAFSSLAGALSGLAGENKELAAAGALIDTYAGANKAFAQGGVAGFVSGAAIIAAGLANLKKIYETPVSGSSGGSSGAGAIAQPPAPQMMSGAFQLSGGQAPEAMRAYVVTDEMTNSQNQLANIRRRATI